MNMLRIEALKILSSRLPYSKMAERVTANEFDGIVDFIAENEHLSHLEFEYAINRRRLNKEKSKNWKIVDELLLCSNTMAKGK